MKQSGIVRTTIRERERAKGMNERKMASYCSDSRFFRLLLEREKKKRK